MNQHEFKMVSFQVIPTFVFLVPPFAHTESTKINQNQPNSIQNQSNSIQNQSNSIQNQPNSIQNQSNSIQMSDGGRDAAGLGALTNTSTITTLTESLSNHSGTTQAPISETVSASKLNFPIASTPLAPTISNDISPLSEERPLANTTVNINNVNPNEMKMIHPSELTEDQIRAAMLARGIQATPEQMKALMDRARSMKNIPRASPDQALIASIKMKNTENCKMLIEKAGANPDARDAQGNTALHWGNA